MVDNDLYVISEEFSKWGKVNEESTCSRSTATPILLYPLKPLICGQQKKRQVIGMPGGWNSGLRHSAYQYPRLFPCENFTLIQYTHDFKPVLSPTRVAGLMSVCFCITCSSSRGIWQAITWPCPVDCHGGVSLSHTSPMRLEQRR